VTGSSVSGFAYALVRPRAGAPVARLTVQP